MLELANYSVALTAVLVPADRMVISDQKRHMCKAALVGIEYVQGQIRKSSSQSPAYECSKHAGSDLSLNLVPI